MVKTTNQISHSSIIPGEISAVPQAVDPVGGKLEDRRDAQWAFWTREAMVSIDEHRHVYWEKIIIPVVN